MDSYNGNNFNNSNDEEWKMIDSVRWTSRREAYEKPVEDEAEPV